MGSLTWWPAAGPPSSEAAATSDFELRVVSKVADEDVTQFGEELQDLHIDTLTTKLDPSMRQDYQRALDAYENAKSLMRDARRPEDVTGVTKALEDGRYAKACVLARMSGEALPERRPPCFFNPAHGPAQTDVEWAPLGGVAREIPVCLADANRLAQGAEPEARMVRSGSKIGAVVRGRTTLCRLRAGLLRGVGYGRDVPGLRARHDGRLVGQRRLGGPRRLRRRVRRRWLGRRRLGRRHGGGGDWGGG